MFTTWDQVESWIKDNGFKRWVLFKDASKSEKIIDSASFTVSDQADKLAMTEKYLRMAGGRAYAAGAPSGSASDLTTTAEIRLESEQPAAGAGQNIQPFSIGDLEDSIRKQVKAEFDLQRFADERKAFEAEKKAFKEKEEGVWGLLVNKLAPVAIAAMQSRSLSGALRNVAGAPVGIDAEEDVRARRIVPEDGEPIREKAADEPAETDEPSVWDEFTEEEAEQVMTLLARFKKVEPDYLQLIESVVTMAEAGDSTYKMAKGFLIK